MMKSSVVIRLAPCCASDTISIDEPYVVYQTSTKGYYPTRSDTLPLIETCGAENEIWALGLTFLDYGNAEPAWASWTNVRRDVGDTFNAVIQDTPADIPTLLEELNAKAVQAIEEIQ